MFSTHKSPMTKPFILMSDQHLHRWSAFATTLPDGTNSRLSGLLAEILRAGQVLLAAGGTTMVFAGDLFHVRGQIAPSVLNPTLDVFSQLRDMGIEIIMIPGNHDLEGKESERLNSAVTSLESVGVRIANEPVYFPDVNVAMVPWVEKIDDLKKTLEALKIGSVCDLVIHAPVNGAVIGIPDHGLEPGWLAALGYRRVFAGHYHNHVEFPGGVYSIGALSHQTWNDVGTKAGFLLVHPDRIEHFESALPKFIDITPDMPVPKVVELVKGNYARVRMSSTKTADIEQMREWLTKAGALGVVILSVKAAVQERDGSIAASVNSGASVGQSVSEFIGRMTLADDVDRNAVSTRALKKLAEAEVV